MIEDLDYLRSERWKLKKQLDVLERDFEAKSKIYSKHSEDKKLERAKKNFQIKQEIIESKISSIEENIKKIQTKKRMEEDVAHKREWENIKSELMGYSDKNFRSFLKQFGQSCIKLKRPMLKLEEIYQEIDLPAEIIIEIIQLIKNKGYRGVCGITSFDDWVSTRFARELSKI